MRNIKFMKNLLALVLFSFSFLACDKVNVEEPSGKYSDGFFIVNEGPFQNGTGTISYYDASTNTVENNIFQTVNERPLGNVVQSLTIFKGKGYIVVNNAEKVEVVNSADFRSTGIINNVILPRYFVGINENKGYLTVWGANFSNGAVKVIDLATNEVSKTIPTGLMPEKLIKVNNKVYVVNGSANSVSVINTTSDEVEATVTLGDRPNSIQVDATGKVWVLCSGKKTFTVWPNIDEAQSTPASLWTINVSNNTASKVFDFPEIAPSASKLEINESGNKLFFSYANKIYTHTTSSTNFNSTILVDKSFYGLAYDKKTRTLLGGVSPNFSSNGTFFKYNSETGAQMGSGEVGIGPNGFAFNE
jgi:YVTN family beta-propeller protein